MKQLPFRRLARLFVVPGVLLAERRMARAHG
jgi:hypothetical protein